MTNMYLFLVSQLRVTGPKILAVTFANRITTVTGCKSAAKFLTAVDRAAEGLHVFLSSYQCPVSSWVTRAVVGFHRVCFVMQSALLLLCSRAVFPVSCALQLMAQR